MILKNDILKDQVPCLIENNYVDKKVLIKTIQYLGGDNYIYYPTFVDALRDFDKFYALKHPDFILCEWYDDFEDSVVIEQYNKSCIKDIPLVIHSYNDQQSIRQKAKEIGAVMFLSKPIEFRALHIGIAQILAQKNDINKLL